MKGFTFFYRYVYHYAWALGFCLFCGFSISELGKSVGIYRRVCLDLYADDGRVDCGHLNETKWAENEVQKANSQLNIYLAMSYFVPGIFAGLFLGAWGDKYGRKMNIIVGNAGLMISAFGILLVLSSPAIPTYTLVFTSILSGFTGDFGVVIITFVALITDGTVRRSTLTERITLFQLFMFFGGAAGSLLGSGISHFVSDTYLVCIGMCVTALVVVLSAVLVPDALPLVFRGDMLRKEAATLEVEGTEVPEEVELALAENAAALATAAASEASRPPGSKCSELGELLALQRDALAAYGRRRAGSRRGFVLVCVISYLALVTAEAGAMSVTSLYLQKSPFLWSAGQLGLWGAVDTTSGVVVSAVLLGVLRRGLGWGDTSLVLLSLCARIAGLVCLGLATQSWHIFAVSLISSPRQLGAPTIKAFVSKMVGEEEIGKIYSVFGLALNIGVLLGAVALASLYKATVETLPSLVFFVCAAAIGALVPPLVWVHVRHRLDARGPMDTQLHNEIQT